MLRNQTNKKFKRLLYLVSLQSNFCSRNLKTILSKSSISSCAQLFASPWSYRKLRIRYTYTHISCTDVSKYIFFFMANSHTLAVTSIFLGIGHSNAHILCEMVNGTHQHRAVITQLPKREAGPEREVRKSLCPDNDCWKHEHLEGDKIFPVGSPTFLGEGILIQICVSLAIRIPEGERINLSQGVQVKERIESSVSFQQEPLLGLQEVSWALVASGFFPCTYDGNKSSLSTPSLRVVGDLHWPLVLLREEKLHTGLELWGFSILSPGRRLYDYPLTTL